MFRKRLSEGEIILRLGEPKSGGRCPAKRTQTWEDTGVGRAGQRKQTGVKGPQRRTASA